MTELTPWRTARDEDGHALAEALDEIARPAAAAIAAAYARRADHQPRRKSDGSPVTEVDVLADALLTGGLRRRFPDWPVVSEEAPASHARAPAGPYWLLDPLDGTREFIGGTGEFCICLALVESGVPVFGFVYAPLDLRYDYAWRGAGCAYAKTAHAPPRRLTRPRPPARASSGLRVGVSRHHRDAATDAFLATLREPLALPMGSALKFCAIAEDRLDVYVRHGPTMHWDTAAGQCLLEAVGFGVYDLATGAPLRYDTPTRRNPGFLAGPFGP